MNPQTILQQAQKLNTEEKLELVEEILLSISSRLPITPEQKAELDVRSKAVENGSMPLIDGDLVMKKLKAYACQN